MIITVTSWWSHHSLKPIHNAHQLRICHHHRHEPQQNASRPCYCCCGWWWWPSPTRCRRIHFIVSDRYSSTNNNITQAQPEPHRNRNGNSEESKSDVPRLFDMCRWWMKEQQRQEKSTHSTHTLGWTLYHNRPTIRNIHTGICDDRDNCFYRR